MIQIIIADDEALFRKGLSSLIEEFPGISVAGEAANGQELVERLRTTSPLPDIILLDLNMPVLNGIEAAKLIREEFPEVKIIVLSTHFSKAFVINMIEMGAAAYLPKNTLPKEVAHTLREVAEKGFYYQQGVMQVIRENMMQKTRPKISSPFEVSLTRREQEILQLICEEHTTPEIAEKLFLSTRTVEGHRNNLLQKLGCKNTAGLVVYALQHQLVNLPPHRF